MERAVRSPSSTPAAGWTDGDQLDAKVTAQAERASSEADLVLFVVDATVGVTSEDERLARLLRRRATPVVLVANKVDNEQRGADAWDFVRSASATRTRSSALHGRGSATSWTMWCACCPEDSSTPRERVGPTTSTADSPTTRGRRRGRGRWTRYPRVAIVGRPNVGKSTLFNRLVGEERSIVHDLPGTTRDAVDTLVETADGPIRFVDTAGMRRKSRASDDGRRVLLAGAGAAGARPCRRRAARHRRHRGRHPPGPAAGRTDRRRRQPGRDPPQQVGPGGDASVARGARLDVGDRLAFLAYAPVLKISARTGLGVHRLLPAIRGGNRGLPPADPDRQSSTGPCERSRPPIRLRGPASSTRVQGAADPPTFTLFASRRLPATWLRYLERGLRERFDIGPTPIKIRVRIG